MKVIYELNLPDDEFDFKLIRNSSDMYNALFNIDEILRKYRNGWIENPNVDDLIEEISTELFESKIRDIE